MPLQVKLSICKTDGQAEETSTPTNDPRLSKSLANLDFQSSQNSNDDDDDDNEEDTKLYTMSVESSGKYTRKATWEDLNRYTGQEMTPEVLIDWIVNYQKKCFPEDLEKPFHTPKKAYIRDENGGTIYKDFAWKPIKLNLAPGFVDTKERWTKEVCLESFPLDYSTSLEQILLQQGDKKITSTLRKSKLAGHELAKEMMKTDSEITTAFEGIESVAFGVLGNREPSEVDEATGYEVWNDVKSLRALLHGATLPKKEGAGVTREAKVLANESYLKARIYYKCYFSNDVATDHEGKFDGKPYWKFPMKYLMQYNGMPKQIVVYEDVELRFFTDIRVAMDNKDWEWVKDENGRWKKQFAAVTTSVSRRKSDGDNQVKDTAKQAIIECSEEEGKEEEPMPEKEQNVSMDTTKTEETAVSEESVEPTEKENAESPEPEEAEKEVAEPVNEGLKPEVTTEEEVAEPVNKGPEPEVPTEKENAEPVIEHQERLAPVDKENLPAVEAMENLLPNTHKPDPDGAVLDDSVGRMSIGENSLEP